MRFERCSSCLHWGGGGDHVDRQNDWNRPAEITAAEIGLRRRAEVGSDRRAMISAGRSE